MYLFWSGLSTGMSILIAYDGNPGTAAFGAYSLIALSLIAAVYHYIEEEPIEIEISC